ncbi:MAG: glycosyltransferase family 2 protein [Ignavibacteria bacterium]
MNFSENKNQSWSIIIFGYNEEDTIAAVAEKAMEFLKNNNISNGEILIVDDGSRDNTPAITRNLEAKNYIRIIRHEKNLGIGPALVTGYNNARCENIVAVPADGQFDISELQPYVNFAQKSFISYYREEVLNYSPYRNVVTFTNKLFNKIFLNLRIKDINWVKAYKSKELRSLDLKLNSSLIGSEICAKLVIKGCDAIEAPSVYHQRIAGKARGASLKTLSHAVKELLKLVLIIRTFKKSQKRQ